MDQPARNLLTGTLVKYVLLFVNIVLGIFLMPFTIHRLGQAEYGLWMLVASMTAYFQLLDLGYGSGLVRQITHADARGDEDEINGVLSTFVVVYSGLAMIVLLATAGLTAFVLPRFDSLSPADLTTARWILAILGARIALGFPMSVFGAVTTARQQFALTGSIAIAAALLQGAATWLVLSAGYGVVTLVGVTTAISVISYIAYAAAARHAFPGLSLSVSRFSVAEVRDVTTFSFYLFLISVAVYLATSVDNVVIAAYMSTSAIAVYTVAARLAEYQRQVCGQFTGFLFPLVVRFHASQDAGALRATLLDGTRIALGLAAGCALCMIGFGRELIDLWMGRGFEPSAVPLYVLALAGIVMVAQGPTGTILLGTGRHRLVAWTSILEIGLNAAVSIALVGRYGLVGVALGTAIPYVLLNVLVLMPLACRAVGVRLGEFLRVSATPTLAALAIGGLTAVALHAVVEHTPLAILLLNGTAVAAAYAAAFWLIGLSAADRARYTASMRQLAGPPAVPRVAMP